MLKKTYRQTGTMSQYPRFAARALVGKKVCSLTLNYQVLRLRNVVKKLLISIGCVTMLFVSHLYFVNMRQ